MLEVSHAFPSVALLACTVLCLSPLSLGNTINTPSKCGIRNVGGVDAGAGIGSPSTGESDFGEFPWTVDITSSQNPQYLCAGSLIHPKVVLTAGQCLQTEDSNDLIIRAGIWDRYNNSERLPYQKRRIEKVIVHPERNRFKNEFALIILTEPFILAAHINVICLPPANHVIANGTACYASGWGQTKTDVVSRRMKRVTLSTMDLETCKERLIKHLDNSVICAFGDSENDTDAGDSGAPLVSRVSSGSEEQYQQIGITSFGLLSYESFPSGYSNVTSARSWIDTVMTANGLETSSYSI